MSTFIPTIQAADFIKVLESGKIAELKSCRVQAGDTEFTVIIGHGDFVTKDYADTQAEYLAVKSNITGGKDLEEISLPMTAVERMAHARAAKKAKENRLAAV